MVSAVQVRRNGWRGQMFHEVSRDILNTWAATKICAYQWTQDFTSLIPYSVHLNPNVESMVGAQRASNCSMKEKTSKRSEILRFLFVLLPCHLEFFSVSFCNTKISEISDMAKSWATFVAQALIKTIKVYCCGNKIHNSIFVEGNTSVRAETLRFEGYCPRFFCSSYHDS